MAKPTTVNDEPFSFPVTCVIGEVTVDPHGMGMSPHAAAFALIADHDVPGTYRFPMRGGGECVVSYEYVMPGTEEPDVAY